ncbi:MAG: hypothetical protein Q9190_000514 [Brigantiaea leucoxantha]
MVDSLYELLYPYFDNPPSQKPFPSSTDPTTTKYLTRLSTLSLSALTSTEPQSIAQASHSTNLSIQALSSRSNAAVIASSNYLSSLQDALPLLAEEAQNLKNDIPKLDESTASFSMRYSRSHENEKLDRRKKALLMERNADRLSDILDLPILLSSSISSSAAQGAASATSYASALDLHSHIKRLHLLYKDSSLINSIYSQTEAAMQELMSNLIWSLRAPNIKLAAAMRAIGWLRRVAPDLDSDSSLVGDREGLLGYLFLTCRLSTLHSTLSALEPLRQLADQETENRQRIDLRTPKEVRSSGAASDWHGGQQTERYLKRYIEIFREQSFSIVSMYKSIFPASPDTSTSEELNLKFKSVSLQTATTAPKQSTADDPFLPTPSALSAFPFHLVGMLSNVLQQYLPNVRDRSSRESLLTQILYCAGSLGRLGGDFSLLVACLPSLEEMRGGDVDDESDDTNDEWIEVMKKHRELAGRLEALASGVGTGKGVDKGSTSTAV